MKKLMLLGIVGTMFVVGQSLVFAGGIEKTPEARMEKMTLEKQIDVVESTESLAAEVSMVEFKITAEMAKEYAEVLGLNTKDIEGLSMTKFMESLSKEQESKLVDAGLIIKQTASGPILLLNEDDLEENIGSMTFSVEAIVDGETYEAQSN